MSALEQLKAHVKAERKAGRQISWTAGFAVSRPTLRQIREWFDAVPANLRKAEAIEWLAQRALDESSVPATPAPEAPEQP